MDLIYDLIRFQTLWYLKKGFTSGPWGPGGPGGPDEHPGITGFCFSCTSPPKTLGSNTPIPSFNQTRKRIGFQISGKCVVNEVHLCKHIVNTYWAAPLPQLRWRRVERRRWRWHETTGVKCQRLIQKPENWEGRQVSLPWWRTHNAERCSFLSVYSQFTHTQLTWAGWEDAVHVRRVTSPCRTQQDVEGHCKFDQIHPDGFPNATQNCHTLYFCWA